MLVSYAANRLNLFYYIRSNMNKTLMPMYRFLILCISFSALFTACTEKETINHTEHTNVIIDDNTAPPYDEVTTVQIQNYINKMYIDLIGREPLQQELEDDTDLLKSNNLSLESRIQLLNQLMSDTLYHDRFFDIYSTAYLNGTQEPEIIFQINQYKSQKEQAEQAGNYAYAQYLQLEIDKLDNLLASTDEYENNEITVNEFMLRVSYNYFYDQINMGSENFVKACFENFLKRFPTDSELSASVAMVDGVSSQLLLRDGSTKKEFIEIITTYPGFYEGLAIDIYQQLLARNPDSEEMNDATLLLTEDPDYQSIQQAVIVSSEYAGF